jgi:hypothetical protein
MVSNPNWSIIKCLRRGNGGLGGGHVYELLWELGILKIDNNISFQPFCSRV